MRPLVAQPEHDVWPFSDVATTSLPEARISLCPLPDDKRGCDGAPFSRSARTTADGSYWLTDVPPGDFFIHVDVPAGTPDCDGLFRETGGARISPGRSCVSADGKPRPCQEDIFVCLPFEMPPPPP